MKVIRARQLADLTGTGLSCGVTSDVPSELVLVVEGAGRLVEVAGGRGARAGRHCEMGRRGVRQPRAEALLRVSTAGIEALTEGVEGREGRSLLLEELKGGSRRQFSMSHTL